MWFGLARRPKVAFFHIPKTGGMTIREVLGRVYGAGFHVVERPEVASIKADVQRFDCVEFHTIPCDGEFIQPHREIVAGNRWDALNGAALFCMFREPIGAFVSLYYDAIRKREFVEGSYTRNGFAFPESLYAYTALPYHHNAQLAFLVGKYPLVSKEPVDRDDLLRAKEFLARERFTVGLLEEFDESMRALETISKRSIPPRIEVVNRNEARPPLEAVPESLRERVREANQLDIELYEFVLDLWAAQQRTSVSREVGVR